MCWSKVLGGAVAATVGVASLSVAEAEIVHVTLDAEEVNGAFEPVSDEPLTVTFSYDTQAEGVFDGGVGTDRYPFIDLQIERFGDTLDFLPDVELTTTAEPFTGVPEFASIFIAEPLSGEPVADGFNLYARSTSILGPINVFLNIWAPDGTLPDTDLPTLAEMMALAAGEVPAAGPATPLVSGLVVLEFNATPTYFLFSPNDVTVTPEPTAALALLTPLALCRRRRHAA